MSHQDDQKNTEEVGEVGPGTDHGAREGADAFQTKNEAKQKDKDQRDDLTDDDIISLDATD